VRLAAQQSHHHPPAASATTQPPSIHPTRLGFSSFLSLFTPEQEPYIWSSVTKKKNSGLPYYLDYLHFG
jgi:hypothetical protein